MTGIRAELNYNIKLALIVTILLAIVTSCRVIDIKQLKEKVIPPSNFQILGFYYHEYHIESHQNASNQTIPEETFYKPIILFKDGSCFRSGGFSSLSEIQTYFRSKNVYDQVGVGTGWGNYFINGRDMTIQTVEMLSSGGIPVLVGVVEQKGIWLNDSTFVIRSQSIPRMKLTSSFKKEESYRFSLLAKKPDSLNWLKEKINPTKMNSKE